MPRPDDAPQEPGERRYIIPPRQKPDTDSGYFAVLAQATFQAGFSWEVVRNKWPSFVKAFDGFDIDKVARYGPDDIDRLLADKGIVRNGRKIEAVIHNASVMRHQSFATKGVRGYGLLQRDRNFNNYQDIFNHYHLVPSVWIEPRGNWGEGDIHLLELSTVYEGLDNIVAFFDPKTKPAPLQPFRFGYTMFWTRETDRRLSENIVTGTRIGADGRDRSRREICIDFKGPKLDTFTDADPPQPIASCSPNGSIIETLVFRNPFDGSWRVVLKLQPAAGNTEPIDLRCTLKKGEDVVSETWTYLWSPP